MPAAPLIGMGLDPLFVDLIVRPPQKVTGGTGIHAAIEFTFDELS
jgi:hypothetical protein